MVTNEEKKIVARKVEEYNNLIERAIPLMQEKQGIFNQLFYLNHISAESLLNLSKSQCGHLKLSILRKVFRSI